MQDIYNEGDPFSFCESVITIFVNRLTRGFVLKGGEDSLMGIVGLRD